VLGGLARRLAGNNLICTGAIVLSYPLVFIAALAANPWAFGLVALAGYVAEGFASRSAPLVVTTLNKVHMGVTVRFILREIALLMLLARQGETDPVALLGLASGFAVLHGLRAMFATLTLYVTARRKMPAVTRNVDLSALNISDGPPNWLSAPQALAILFLDVTTVAGALTGRYALAATGLAITLIGATAAVAVMAWHAYRVRPLGDRERVLSLINEKIKEHRPEVVLYFSGGRDSTYQINMWLSTVDRLDRRAVILMRERALVPLLGRTSTPVVCVPGGADLMNLELPDVRVALYVSNVGKNIHLLRVPGVKHVFIGHGDSDKQASFNPFSKVYDEVWVAGPAGRDRYRRARVGVPDSKIVEVGRPQLSPVETAPAAGTAGPMMTVVYAPTWEGWTEDLQHTSVAAMGVQIVATLLAHSPRVRLLYKPHPLTGIRDPATLRAHERIVAMVEKAAAEHPENNSPHPARRAAAVRLAGLDRRIAASSGSGSAHWDEARVAREAGMADPATVARRLAEWEALQHLWSETYWDSEGRWRHRVVTGPRPELYDCFNQADLLITDISSVVADFVASQKPYVVTNVAGLPDEHFRAEYPSASAAYLLNGDCSELDSILTKIREGEDVMAARRRELKAYLLGPDQPNASTRFNAAVNRLVEAGRGDARPEEPDPGGLLRAPTPAATSPARRT
jgi:hypothetical protein